MNLFMATPYILLLLSCVLLAWIAQRFKKRIAVWMIILLLTLFAGLRADNVGVDTMNYTTNLSNGYYRLYEIGFRLLSEPFAINGQVSLYLLCVAAIINTLFILRLWELRDSLHFSFAVFLFIIMHFSATMNTMRQYIACAIIFWGTRFLFQRKAVPYIICVLTAMCFHKTSFIAMGLLAVYFVNWRHMNGIQKLLSICLFLTLPVGLYYIYTTELIDYVTIRSQYYFRNEAKQGWFIYFEVAVMLLLPLLNRQKVKCTKSEQVSVTRVSWLFGFLGIVLSLIGYQIQFMGRIALYYSIFSLPLYSIAWKTTHIAASRVHGRIKTTDLFTRLAILCVTVPPFILQLINNSYRILPYTLR